MTTSTLALLKIREEFIPFLKSRNGSLLVELIYLHKNLSCHISSGSREEKEQVRTKSPLGPIAMLAKDTSFAGLSSMNFPLSNSSGLLFCTLRNSCSFPSSPPCHVRLAHPEESGEPYQNYHSAWHCFPFPPSQSEVSECLENVANPLNGFSWGFVVSNKATINTSGAALRCSDSNRNAWTL